jgi:hypothetical protein
VDRTLGTMGYNGTLGELLRTSADRTPDAIALREGEYGWRVEVLPLLPTAPADFVEADEHEHHDLSSLPRTGTGKLDRHTLETQVTSDLASC